MSSLDGNAGRMRAGVLYLTKLVLRGLGVALGLVVLYPIWRVLTLIATHRSSRHVGTDDTTLGFDSDWASHAARPEQLLEEAEPADNLVIAMRQSRWSRRVLRLVVLAVLFPSLVPLSIALAPPAYAQVVVNDVEVEVFPNNLPVGTTYTVTATVTTVVGGLPVVGAQVAFSASLIAGPNANQPQFDSGTQADTATTDASGRATTTIRSTNAGTTTITATTTGASDATTTATWTSSFSGYRVSAQSPQQERSCFPITITAVDEVGNPVSDTSEAVISSASNDGDTDLMLHVNASCLDPGAEDRLITVAGSTTVYGRDFDLETVTITASEVGPGARTGSTTVTILPAPSAIDLQPENDSNPAGTTHTVTATVSDRFDEPVSGTVVTFTYAGPGAQGRTELKTTNQQGQATFSFRSTLTGTSRITSTVATLTGFASDTATKTWTPATPTLVLDPKTDTNRTGSSHTVTATVADVFGNVISGAVVTFTFTGPGAQGATELKTTNNEGRASFTFSSNLPGNSRITATVTTESGSATDTATKSWVPTSAAIDLQPEDATNTVGTTHTVTATVTDEFGNPVSGAVVTFTYTGPGAQGRTELKTTDNGGEATFSFRSTLTGTSRITASVVTGSGVASDTATKTWIAATPSAITLLPETDSNQAGTTHTVTATITDRFGNRVPTPTVVTFSYTGPGAQGATEAKTTNGESQATFSFSSTRTGRSFITATIVTNPGDPGPPSFATDTATKDWTITPSGTVDLQPPSDSNRVGTTHTVTATVRDDFGNPVVGARVTFTAQGTGTEQPSSGIEFTDDNGRATFSFRATRTGTSTITATAQIATGTATDTATKEWTAGPILRYRIDVISPQFAGDCFAVTITAVDEFSNPTVPTRSAVVDSPSSDDGDSQLNFHSTSSCPEPETDGDAIIINFSGSVSSTFFAKDFDAETVSIRAREIGGPTTGTATVTILSAQAAGITLEPRSDDNLVGTSHTVTATVSDQFGNPTPTPTVVTFTAGGTGGESPTSATRTTNADGQASFTFTSSQDGTSTITATADVSTTDTATATKIWRPAAAAVDLQPENATNTVGTTHTVTATVQDRFGNPVSETAVTFAYSGPGAQGATELKATNNNGQATFSFSSEEAGTSRITATVVSGTTTASDTATKTWVAGAAATITLQPKESSNPTGSSHTVTGSVKDQFGNPVSDTVVTFTFTGPGPQGTTELKTTNDDGQASFTFTSTLPGNSRITATVTTEAGTDSDTATKTWFATSAVIDLEPENATNTVGTTHTVTATVSDNFNNPVSGAVVTFTFTGPGAQGRTDLKTTDNNGEATFSFSSNLTGTSRITASVRTTSGVASDTATKTWTAASATTITVEPENATNTVGTTHTVTGTVRDRFGNPVPTPTAVTFSYSGPGAQGATQLKTTNSNGQATFSFRSTSTGVSRITATIVTDPGSPGTFPLFLDARPATTASDTATKTWVPGAPASISVTPTADSNPAGSQHTVTATVRDSFGHTVSQTAVTFTAGGTGFESPNSRFTTTDQNGQATYTFTSIRTGTSTITATAGSASATATKNWTPGPADRVTLRPPSDTNQVNTQHAVTATVTDANGNPVPGTLVTFTAAGTGVETPPNGSDTTDQNGEADFSLTSTRTGTSTITATAAGRSATAIKTWTAGAPSGISVTPTSDSNEVNTPHTVTASVVDQFGNPVAGTVVTFTASGSGFESPSSGSDISDSGGRASFTFTSSRVGTSRITATAGGVSATATKTWFVGPPASILLTPASDVNDVGSTHTVTATVRDNGGNGVPGAVVTFTVGGTGGESPTGATATTNSDGQATFSFVSSRGGRSTITATAGNASANATKDWRVEPAPPSPSRVQYLPEGSTTGGFTTFLLIANPQTSTVAATVTFLTDTGPTSPPSVRNIAISPGSRYTIDVGVLIGKGRDVGAKVEASDEVVAEMSMHVAGSRANADTIGSPVVSNQWIMAEGATHSDFKTFVQIVNPDLAQDTLVKIDYLLGNGTTIDGGTLPVPAGSRRTIDVNLACACSADISTHVRVVGARPSVVASVSIHKLGPSDLGIGGSIGITAPGDTFVVAEGATHSGWTTFVLVANPLDIPATINVTFLTKSNGTRAPAGLQGRTIPPRSRFTINVNNELGVSDDVSTIVDATSGQIAVESTIQKSDLTGFVIADSIGAAGADVAAAGGTRWLAAEGTTQIHDGSRFTTFILIANPTNTDSFVQLTFLTKEHGRIIGPIVVVPANSRRTVDVNVTCGCPDDDVSTLVEVLSGGKVVVEMSLDWARQGAGFSKGRSISARMS